jgi:hypothetical protein
MIYLTETSPKLAHEPILYVQTKSAKPLLEQTDDEPSQSDLLPFR